MEQYGNQSTYNLETVLKQNIGNADFYRNDCMKLNTWAEVIDQIFYQVCLTALSAAAFTHGTAGVMRVTSYVLPPDQRSPRACLRP